MRKHHMLSDFKIIEMNESDESTTVKVRFYEGAINTKNELAGVINGVPMGKGIMRPVTRYRRSKMIGEKTYSFNTGTPFQKIHRHCCGELANDKSRIPIDSEVLLPDTP